MVYVVWKLNNPSHKSFKGAAKAHAVLDDFHTVGIVKLEKEDFSCPWYLHMLS